VISQQLQLPPGDIMAVRSEGAAYQQHLQLPAVTLACYNPICTPDFPQSFSVNILFYHLSIPKHHAAKAVLRCIVALFLY